MSKGLGRTQKRALAAVYSLIERGWVMGRFRPEESECFYRVSAAKVIREVTGFTGDDVRANRSYHWTERGLRPTGYQRWRDAGFSTELAIKSELVTRAEAGAIKRALAGLARRGLLIKDGKRSYTTPEEHRRNNTPEKLAGWEAMKAQMKAMSRG